jgi:PAS domain S-box-containing protein
MVKIQTRLILLLLAVIGCFLTGLFTLDGWEKSKEQMLLADYEAGKQKLLRDIIDLKGASLASLVYDYSFWDDMIGFIETGDREWARTNLETSLSTYQIDALWVTRTDLSLVYGIDDGPGDSLMPLPMGTLSPATLFAPGYFRHFFVPYNNTFMEIRIAPIQPTDDAARISRPRGFLFAAKIWNDSLLKNLGKFTGGSMTLSPIDSVRGPWLSNIDDAVIRYMDTLSGWNGRPVAVIRGRAPSSLLGELDRAVSRRLLIAIGFAFALVLSLIFAIRGWLTRPLNAISQALTTEDPAVIDPVTRIRSEFGLIASLITEFFRQKRELVEANIKAEKLTEEQRVIFENAQDFIYRHDTKGVFHYLSASVEQVTGYTAEEFLSHYTTYMTDNPINAKVMDFTEQALQTGKAFPPYLVEVRRKDNRCIMLEVSEKPYFDNGRVAGIVGIARDVTERYQTETERRELLSQLEKAQRMQSLAVLAGGVAHDLNNILGPMVAYPELILLKLPPDSPVRDKVESMGRAASQAASIIDDLLTMARRGRYDMSPLNLNNIIRKYINSPEFHELRRRNPGIQVHLELDTMLPAVMGSDSHLSTALSNLVNRAFESMPEGGHITINSRNAYIEKLESGYDDVVAGDYTIITVIDTGSSIAQEDIHRIFEPYFSKKMAGSGSSGLGLSIVYGIVKDHTGYYDINSAPGKGTSFSILLPSVTENTDIARRQADVLTGTETILIVDDHEEQRTMAADILRELGYTVKLAANSRVALEQIDREVIDLIVLDMILDNDCDGLELYRRILAIHPGQRTIIISGFGLSDRVKEMQTLGAGLFVPKPFTRQELATAVRRELDRLIAQPIKM